MIGEKSKQLGTKKAGLKSPRLITQLKYVLSLTQIGFGSISLRLNKKNYFFFFAATFLFATAFVAGFFEAGDLVVFLAICNNWHPLLHMARKILH